MDEWTRKALPASGRRATTRANYTAIARTHLVPAPFGALPLDRLRPSDVEALLVAKRGAGLSSSTVQGIYVVCRAALNVAARDGIVGQNVAPAVKRPTAKRADARHLTAQEVGQLLDAARDDRLLPLLVLLLGTGMRRGEALALPLRDVNLTAGYVRGEVDAARVDGQLAFDEPKTERSWRFVSLPSPVVETLRRHRSTLAAERLAAAVWAPWPEHDDLVFTTTQIGTPIDPGTRLEPSRGSQSGPG